MITPNIQISGLQNIRMKAGEVHAEYSLKNLGVFPVNLRKPEVSAQARFNDERPVEPIPMKMMHLQTPGVLPANGLSSHYLSLELPENVTCDKMVLSVIHRADVVNGALRFVSKVLSQDFSLEEISAMAWMTYEMSTTFDCQHPVSHAL